MQQKSQPAQPLASNDSPSVHQPCEERLPEKANAVNILPAGGSLPTNSNMLAAECDRQSRLTIRPAGGPTSPTTPETAAIARSMRKPGGSSSSRLACAPVSPLQCCVCDARCLELGCAPLMSADFVHAAVRHAICGHFLVLSWGRRRERCYEGRWFSSGLSCSSACCIGQQRTVVLAASACGAGVPPRRCRVRVHVWIQIRRPLPDPYPFSTPLFTIGRIFKKCMVHTGGAPG